MKTLLHNQFARILVVTIALAVTAQPGCLFAGDEAGQENSLGDAITLRFRDLKDLLHNDKQRLTNSILFLNCIPMRGLHPISVCYPSNTLTFVLQRNPENDEQWRLLLKATKHTIDNVEVAAGFEDDGEHLTLALNNSILFRKFSRPIWMIIAVSLIVALSVLLFIYGSNSNLLRDATPYREKDFKQVSNTLFKWLPGLNTLRANGFERPPFSLARVQMAFWFLLIASSYLFIWLVFDERNSFNATALTLLGITLATGLVARVIDNSKIANVQQLDAERQQLEARQKELQGKTAAPSAEEAAELARIATRLAEIDKRKGEVVIPPSDHKSEGFFMDILSDENGISLQRLQMLGWTLILGLVFIADVYNKLAMPEFNNTLLGLMGISSGAFIGFKVPEKQPIPEAKK